MEADRGPPVEGAGREVAGGEDKGWAEEVGVGSHKKEAVGLHVSECVCEEKINVKINYNHASKHLHHN